MCLLRDVNAPSQVAPVQDGRVDLARAVHAQLQVGTGDELQEIVERVTGRTVCGYVPGFNAWIAATTDVFLLDPVEPRGRLRPWTAPPSRAPRTALRRRRDRVGRT